MGKGVRGEVLLKVGRDGDGRALLSDGKGGGGGGGGVEVEG